MTGRLPTSKSRSRPRSTTLLPSPMPAASNRPVSSRVSSTRSPVNRRVDRGNEMSATFTYREAMREAIRDAMTRDDRVFLMGEDVGAYGGSFAVSLGLLEEFGAERIRDSPLSESAFVGAGIGAALGGMRPIVEIMTVNFSLLALDQIMNNAATLLHMSGGQFNVPLVIRMTTGAGRQLAAQHSHSLEGWYGHIPGLKVLTPATVSDARYMLWPALCDPDPVLIFEHGALYNVEDEISVEADGDPWTARVRRSGNDISLITYGGSLPKAIEAAQQLASEGIDVEVVDLRCLRPLDDATIFASVAKTGRAIIVDEGWRTGTSRLRSPPGWSSIRSTISTLQSSASAPPRCPFRMPGISKRLPCHRWGAFSRLPDRWCPAMAETDAMYTMPSLGADMTDGTVIQWLVQPGDVVRRGDIVATIDTDKAEIDAEIFQDGRITELLVPVGERGFRSERHSPA